MSLTELLASKVGDKISQEKSDAKEKETSKEVTPYTIDSSVLEQLEEDNPIVAKVVKALASHNKIQANELAELKSGLKAKSDADSETAKDQKLVAQIEMADKVFDDAAEIFPALGKTEELPRYPDGRVVRTSPEFKERSQIFDIASGFHESLGMPFNKALENAIQWYKGGGVEGEIEKGLIRKIDKTSKKLSAKRSEKHTVKQYANERERKADVVNQSLKKHGVELHE